MVGVFFPNQIIDWFYVREIYKCIWKGLYKKKSEMKSEFNKNLSMWSCTWAKGFLFHSMKSKYVFFKPSLSKTIHYVVFFFLK